MVRHGKLSFKRGLYRAIIRVFHTMETNVKKLLPLFLATLPVFVSAADINCRGKITRIMADHPSCEGHMAFKTETSLSKWMCAKSPEAGSIALTAITTGKTVEVYIDNSDTFSCSELPNYRKISYIIL